MQMETKTNSKEEEKNQNKMTKNKTQTKLTSDNTKQTLIANRFTVPSGNFTELNLCKHHTFNLNE